MNRRRAGKVPAAIAGAIVALLLQQASSLETTVAVFGGSGYIGRRVCRTLVETGHVVVSISRGGAPPACYRDGAWSDAVRWISHDLDDGAPDFRLPPVDAAVSCVGNVRPAPEWRQLFGLGFEDDRLRRENGAVNERAVELAERAGASRFAFISVSYEVAKMLEGPIEGYLDGKRRAESASFKTFGADGTVVVGPSLVYGGRRFPRLGRAYRALVTSPPARAYVAGNDALRNLSVAPLEDWVERTLFSPPAEVEVVARVLCAGALGRIDRGMVGPRRQGFYGTDGAAVSYPDVLFVDGTAEIERVDGLVGVELRGDRGKVLTASVPSRVVRTNANEEKEPPYEGALIGNLPFLYPFPVVLLFASIFWAVATEQFVQVAQ